MEAEFKVFKHEYRLHCQKLFNGFNNEILKIRCESVIGAVYIYSKIISDFEYRSELIGILNRLLLNLASKHGSDVEETLGQLTVQVCKSVIFSLLNLDSPTEQCIDYCLNNKTTLTETMSNAILYSINLSTEPNQNFSVIWKLCLKNLLKKLNLITDSNSFAKNFLSFILIGTHGNNYHTPIENSSLASMCTTLFTSTKNFKFFSKACKICENFKNSVKPENFSSNIPTLTVTLTSIPDHINKQEFQPIEFKLTESGLENSHRHDSLVLVGSHSFCDICLPEHDPNIENISFAIFNNGSDFYILDCGKKSYLSKKIQVDHKYKIHEGIIINLANSALIHLSKQLFEGDGNEVDSELFYEFLTGELSQSSNKVRKLVTRQKTGLKMKKFLVGRGVPGEPANICLSQDNRISGRHLYIAYENTDWFIFDPYSKNGSFILLKNIGQFRQQIFSDCVKLVFNEEFFECFTVAGYSFYFKLGI